jgi:RecG-like helicase
VADSDGLPLGVSPTATGVEEGVGVLVGEARVVVGRLEQYGDEWQIVHPEVMKPDEASGIAIREPVYGLTEGIANKRMRELARAEHEGAEIKIFANR